MTQRRLRRLMTILAAMLLVLVAIAITFCQGGPRYYHRKYEPAGARPIASASHYVLEKQTEPHTCGFHAVSTVYRAFGIDPVASKLRFRLGTDALAHNFDSTSLGTLHPDMLRVVRQDGFAATLYLSPAEEIVSIRRHIEEGFPAIVLVRATGLHWVVLAPQEERATLYDSLREQPVEVVLEEFLREKAINVILLRPE